MNDSRQPIEQKEIDRLVDGELSETERRELLLRFDARGDSWRRLALAFIEIQVWGLEFKAMRSAAATAIPRCLEDLRFSCWRGGASAHEAPGAPEPPPRG